MQISTLESLKARPINPEAAAEFISALSTKQSVRSRALSIRVKLAVIATELKCVVKNAPQHTRDMLKQVQEEFEQLYLEAQGESLSEARIENARFIHKAARLFDASLTADLELEEVE